MSSEVEKHSHHQILPLKVYLAVGAALLLLTFITVEVALHDFGGLNIIIALAIASIKALLVASFFMHLWYDNKFYFICFTVGLLALTVFIIFTMLDTLRRGDIDPATDGPINPRAEMYNSPAFRSGAGTHGAAKADSATFIDSTKVALPADTVKPAPSATPAGH
jgi:cytochrome c oxidase subunit 4